MEARFTIERIETNLANWLLPSADRHLVRVWCAAILLWVLGLIATPIGIWTIGESSFTWLSTLVVLLQLAAVLLALRMTRSLRWVAGVSLVTIFFTWGVEFLGSNTGFPFGDYTYTPALQPQLWGVPILIPLAWLMMLGPAWAVVSLILGERSPKWAFALLSGLAFTAWDLFLDPQMVSKGLWEWAEPGGYFGIPFQNFLGWWLSAALLTFLLRPSRLAQRPLFVIYTMTWVFQALGLGLFWGQPGPALTGLFAMGFFVTLAWKRITP